MAICIFFVKKTSVSVHLSTPSDFSKQPAGPIKLKMYIYFNGSPINSFIQKGLNIEFSDFKLVAWIALINLVR